MAGLSVVEDFLAASAAATSLAVLSALTGDAARELGFDNFAAIHHVPFGVPIPGIVCMTNYPVDFLLLYRDAGRPPDPILRASERVACGFRWDAVEAIVRLSPREERHRAEAARHGLEEGYTMPNHVPGDALGSCSFGAGRGRPLPERSLPAVEALGRFTFEAARRLSPAGAARDIRALPLSDRQRACVLLISQGQSDAAIAGRLGLKRRTVNEHVEAAKRRYGVATRTQLVVLALLTGEIAFAEVIGGHD
jgi:LuxR family quorum-sensing system transcriptional regulator CciR